jgi:hypothetical protein
MTDDGNGKGKESVWFAHADERRPVMFEEDPKTMKRLRAALANLGWKEIDVSEANTMLYGGHG